MTGPARVVCLDCERPLTTPVSRARRIGTECWRRRRAVARAIKATGDVPLFHVDTQEATDVR